MELRIEKGGLEARIMMAPVRKETGDYVVPSLAEIEVFLKEKGVVSPLDSASLAAAFERLAHGMNAEPIATRGRPPTSGKDGWLEFLIDFDGGFAPRADFASRVGFASLNAGGGSVDMRASLILNVNPGQPLALVHPPTAGMPGLDVFGKLVGAEPGKVLVPKLGSNTIRSPHDPNLIVAETLGHARLADGIIEVQEFYLVDGDVDYASGNIAFGKSVQVRGDVKGGFSVDAGGDVEITGLVEDCTVKAQGKVMVKGGFTGQGKGLLQARGEIQIGYVRNQQVRSENSIRVQKEAINSRMQSRNSILVNGLLAGGKAQARFSIECQIAGTETGTPTHIEAGYDYSVSEEMTDLRGEMDRMGRYARKLEDSLRQIHDLEKLNRGLEPWTIELMFEIEGMRAKVDAKIRQLRDRFSALEHRAVQPESATIIVSKKAFPGVIMKIGKEMYLVDEVISGPKTFYAKDGAIVAR
ncbi:MAG: FapA family protein [Fibrobacteria bacterium]